MTNPLPIKVGSFVADDYNGFADLVIGVVLEIDEDPDSEYKYRICFIDDDDSDWYTETGAMEMFLAYRNLVGELA